MNSYANYQSAIRYLEGLANLPTQQPYLAGGSGDRSIHLKRMDSFLSQIGHPEKTLKIIHITGTSGKGSVTNMLHEVLHAAGHCVGSFTSPFVTTSIEKIKVGTRYISPGEFAEIVEELKPIIDRAYLFGPYERPTYFELFFAIALLYFKRMKCEYALLEVGLGGRYDSTNVIRRPLITAITNIDYDHREILGNTLQKIAYDKAGIIKSNSAFITTEKRPRLLRLFRRICEEKRSTYQALCVSGGYRVENESLVRAIGQKLGIDKWSIDRGTRTAFLACRFELMQTKPMVVLDGAHNRAKIRTTVNNIHALRYRKLHLILGFAKNKDQTSILEQIIPLADHVYLTRFQIKDRACAPPKELYLSAKSHLRPKATREVFLDPQRALDRALEAANDEDLVVVTGSFFLAGELRERWIPEERILRRRRAMG